MAKKINKEEKNFEQIEQSLGKAEKFVEKNKNMISYSLLGVLVLILAVMAYSKYIREPKKIEAHNEIYFAKNYFSMDSLDKALYGDGMNPGFLEIIDDYKFTKSANAAKLYAAQIYMTLGQRDTTENRFNHFEEAIDLLKSYSSDDLITTSQAIGLRGDAYIELGKLEKGADLYLKAARKNPDNLTAPYYLQKAGIVYSMLNKHEKALNLFKEIDKEYPQSFEAREIKKYIAKEESFL